MSIYLLILQGLLQYIILVPSNQSKTMNSCMINHCHHACHKNQTVKVRKLKKDSWSLTEQILYVQFLKENFSLMESSESRKSNKVFKRMATAIQTRTSIQSKSHHQKCLERFRNTSNIISEISQIIRQTILMDYEKLEMNDLYAKYVASHKQEAKLQQEVALRTERQEIIRREANQRLLIASYCSFFDEYSDNYGQIQGGVIMEQQLI